MFLTDLFPIAAFAASLSKIGRGGREKLIAFSLENRRGVSYVKGVVTSLNDSQLTKVLPNRVNSFSFQLRNPNSEFRNLACILNASNTVLTQSAYANRFLFTGREWIRRMGIYDYRNRVYSPDLGRFLQSDPIRFDAGDVNLYRYVGNRSTMLRDPYGLFSDKEGDGKPDPDPKPDPKKPKTPDPEPTTPDPEEETDDKPGKPDPNPTDEEIEREMDKIFTILDENDPNPLLRPLEYVALMTGTKLDTAYGPYAKETFEYSGSKYPGLAGEAMKGSELNYIGVGAGFAAGGFSTSTMNAAIMYHKSSRYGEVPSYNTLRAANEGYNAYNNR